MALALAFGLAGQAQEQKTAEQVYKNIQVLQGIPSSKLMPAMQFMAASLGVGCQHCHTNPFEKDEKTAKQDARRMIQMTRRINQEHYGGKSKINCNTCHAGKPQPSPVPSLVRSPSLKPPPTNGPLPTAQQILDKYVQAAGGKAAIEKLTTRVFKGFLEIPGRRVAVERYQKAADRLLMTAQMPNGPSYVGYDGAIGWEQSPAQKAVRQMGPDDISMIRADALFPREIRMGEVYHKLSTTGREKIGEREVFVLDATTPEGSVERLSFDVQTGLLIRVYRIVESLLGPVPSQTDFEDYREIDGVQVPFAVRWSRSDVDLVFRFEEVRHNVAIDDAKFRKPVDPM